MAPKVYFDTMPKEHYGISIIEGMSAGYIPVVHDSGGPREFVPESLRYNDIDDARTKMENAISIWSKIYAEKMFNTA